MASSKGGESTRKSVRTVRTKKTRRIDDTAAGGSESMEPEILLRILFGKGTSSKQAAVSGITSSATSGGLYR